MKHKQTIIFGITNFAEMIAYYFEQDLNERVAGFTVHQQYIDSNNREHQHVIPFETIEQSYPASEYNILPVIGYHDMNDVRRKISEMIKAKGYEIASFIHPSAHIAGNVSLGEGAIVLERVLIQPFVNIGHGNVLWSNVNLSHHTSIGDFNFFAPSSSLAGNVIVEDHCFIGNNSTIRDGVTLGSYSLVGAGAYVSKSTSPYSVIVPQQSVTLPYKSTEIKLM